MIRVKSLTVMLAFALAVNTIAVAARAQEREAKPAEKPAEGATPPAPKEESPRKIRI